MESARARKYGYQVPYAEKIRREAGVMTMAVGHIVHADQAEAILREGRADLCALAREIMYNPNWPMDAAQKLGADPDFKLVPPPYSYWLGKRAKSAFEGKPSTWMAAGRSGRGEELRRKNRRHPGAARKRPRSGIQAEMTRRKRHSTGPSSCTCFARAVASASRKARSVPVET